MPQLREIPLKPKPPFTPTTTGLGSASGIMSLQRSTALVTPPATPSMPPPRYPQPKPPSQELMFRNLIRGPALTLQVSSEAYVLPIALLCHHSGFLQEEIKGISSKRKLESAPEEGEEKKRKLESTPDEGKKSKKRKLESPSPCPSEKETKGEGETCKLDVNEKQKQKTEEEEEEDGGRCLVLNTPLALSLPLTFATPDTFSLFLSYMYKSAYTPSVDALPPAFANTCLSSSTPRSSPFPLAQDFIPPSIHACLLASKLRSPSFLNHVLARIYEAIGLYFPLSPTLMNFVWVQTKSLTLGSGLKTVVPLRRLLLDVLIAHWPSRRFDIIARNDPAAWTMLFEAHQDLRQEFIMGLQGGIKVKEAQG